MTIQSLHRVPELLDLIVGQKIDRLHITGEGREITMYMENDTAIILREIKHIYIEDGVDATNPPELIYAGQWRGLPEAIKPLYTVRADGFYVRKG